MQNSDDVEAVRAYGVGQAAEFGGIYFDGDTLVALFTHRPEWHLGELRPRLRRPFLFRTGETDRTWAAVMASNERVRHRLMDGSDFGAVHGVGITKVDGRFEIQVGVNPLDAEIERAIENAVKPDSVLIRGGGQSFSL